MKGYIYTYYTYYPTITKGGQYNHITYSVTEGGQYPKLTCFEDLCSSP